MAEFKAVGAPVPRAEAGDKVSGQTIYAADVKLPGLLWAKILRSPHPHARIVRVDSSRAAKIPGVKAVITADGGLISASRFAICRCCAGTGAFVGDRVAAVAAETVDAAEEAIPLIDVEYELLPAVFDP
jgi:CO/xanthine dehydrogenase Mo-binding subunit